MHGNSLGIYRAEQEVTVHVYKLVHIHRYMTLISLRRLYFLDIPNINYRYFAVDRGGGLTNLYT